MKRPEKSPRQRLCIFHAAAPLPVMTAAAEGGVWLCSAAGCGGRFSSAAGYAFVRDGRHWSDEFTLGRLTCYNCRRADYVYAFTITTGRIRFGCDHCEDEVVISNLEDLQRYTQLTLAAAFRANETQR
jgi:hypothetical protein